MTYLCDLHMHSTYSDGQYRPAELVRLAKERGLQVIALTDHDAIGGIAEAQAEGEKQGVRVLPGVEFSARDYHTFHILGYCFDREILAKNKLFSRLADGRAERSVRIRDYLRTKGVEVDLDEVRETAGPGVIGRPHFCQVMLRHGVCKTWEEVFDTYLDTDEFHAVVEDKPAAAECIAAVHEAGGIVSMAHPYQTGLEGADLEALVKRMKEAGQLDAIECWHSGHTQERSSFYLSLAKKYHLIVTGGSDFHGEQVKADRPMVRLTLELERMLQR